MPNLANRGCYLFSKEIAIKDIINYKIASIKRTYPTYFHNQLSLKEIPLEEVYYVKLEAWKWICKIVQTQ